MFAVSVNWFHNQADGLRESVLLLCEEAQRMSCASSGASRKSASSSMLSANHPGGHADAIWRRLLTQFTFWPCLSPWRQSQNIAARIAIIAITMKVQSE
jgi:hypothetical protein